MTSETYDLTPAERLQTTFAVAVVKARLTHDSTCRASKFPHEGPDCECDNEATARAVLTGVLGRVLKPSPESFHLLVLSDLQDLKNSDPDGTALTAVASSGSVAANSSPSPG